ncbi:MAG: hypothetical protein ACRD0L_01540, partial [Acidimicrobiales bacterium]
MPVIAFTVPTLLGHVPINGDNPVQNYPLRLLAGRDLASGHLPLWDPYLWSGTPLLAGFNAGAFYPLTALFAVMPPVAAWAATEAALYAVAAVGAFAFFRDCGRSVTAAAFAGASFAFAGFLSAQIGHVDVIEAACVLPWLLLALRRLALSDRARGGWAALLGLGVGIVILAASPEAIIDDVIVIVVYALWMIWQRRDRARSIVALTVLAVLLGVALGSLQWLPGLAWEAHSQRAVSSFAFFASGSLPLRLTMLSVVPWLLGGYGLHGLPSYAGPYNLAEINGYVGILTLMAGCGLLARRFRRHPERSQWLGWYVLVALGLVLAWGGNTPIGHLLHQIPYYGQQRDQSRNLLLVDLGLTGLLASWVDVAILPRAGRSPAGRPRGGGGARPGQGPGGSPDGPRLRLSEMAWAVLPVAGIVALWAVFLADPVGVAHHLGSNPPAPLLAAKADLSVSAAVAVAAALTVALGRGLTGGRGLTVRRRGLTARGLGLTAPGLTAPGRPIFPGLRARGRAVALGAVLVADLAVYGAQQYTFISVPTNLLTGTTPAETALARAAGPGRRIAFYDPTLQPDLLSLFETGSPDLNIVERVPSVNGYGSIVGARYNSATSSHNEDTLSLTAIGGTTLDRLDVGVLAVPTATLAGDAALRAALAPPHWVDAGHLGAFSLWRDTRARGPVWTVPAASAAVGRPDPGPQESSSVVVSARAPVEVVRSLAWAPGWSAELTAADGTTGSVPVTTRGVLQEARVPAGVTRVHWVYRAPRLRSALALA